jgi:hypothetical protein
MFNSFVNGFKRSIRAPILYGLRAIPLYRRVSGLPKNQIVGLESYLDAIHQSIGNHPHPQSLIPIHQSSVVPVKPAGNRNDVPALISSMTEFTTPPTFMARLANQQIFGKGVAIITPDQRLISEVTVHIGGKITEHSVMKRFSLPRLKYLKGTTAVLSSPGANTFYHWLFDLLPRLELIRLAGMDLSEIDRFAVNSIGSRFQRETLSRLSIDPSRIVETDRDQNLLCEEMVLPSFPGITMHPPKWVCDFLVEKFLPREQSTAAAQHKRIYITRRKSTKRHVINQGEIDGFLIKRGFHIVAPEEHDMATQAQIFNQAEIIVAPRGSGLSNLVFCRPGTVVVELFPPNSD